MTERHTHTVTDDPHGRLWRYGRWYANWYDETRPSWGREVNVQWCLFQKGPHAVGFSIGTRTGQDDEDLSVSLMLGRFAWLFLNANGWWLTRQFAKLHGDGPGWGRRLSLTFHDGLIAWQVWAAPMGHHQGARWRDKVWSWKRWCGWEPSHVGWETLDVVRTVVPMPEGTYDATVELKQGTWRRRRLFAWMPKVRKFTYDITPDKPIPVPGKGENSWDCGDDATYSQSGPGRSAAAAVAGLVESVYRDRTRYGTGPSWAPESAQ